MTHKPPQVMRRFNLNLTPGWIVAQTLSSRNEDASYHIHPSNFEKPGLETEPPKCDDIPDLTGLFPGNDLED